MEEQNEREPKKAQGSPTRPMMRCRASSQLLTIVRKNDCRHHSESLQREPAHREPIAVDDEMSSFKQMGWQSCATQQVFKSLNQFNQWNMCSALLDVDWLTVSGSVTKQPISLKFGWPLCTQKWQCPLYALPSTVSRSRWCYGHQIWQSSSMEDALSADMRLGSVRGRSVEHEFSMCRTHPFLHYPSTDMLVLGLKLESSSMGNFLRRLTYFPVQSSLYMWRYKSANRTYKQASMSRWVVVFLVGHR